MFLVIPSHDLYVMVIDQFTIRTVGVNVSQYAFPVTPVYFGRPGIRIIIQNNVSVVERI
ncbi:hypothetical protein SDC9_133618 [bioreactor metagenome]|uniref:Uncharacterized protein n=1 Tax=bioreactor metagenome TaxID=1076179 RepID=A0A645DBF0_9ZZZZ